MNLNEKIVQILESHPDGGEDFFNALDFMIRADKQIGVDFINWVCKLESPIMIDRQFIEKRAIGVVVTGRFGHFLVSNFSRRLLDNFGDLIVVNGGIREGATPEIFKEGNLPCKHYILLDDSYYSGTTADAIDTQLKVIDPSTGIRQVYVIYDGCKRRKSGVKAMFRYYGGKK